jgi:hypothetical protein
MSSSNGAFVLEYLASSGLIAFERLKEPDLELRIPNAPMILLISTRYASPGTIPSFGCCAKTSRCAILCVSACVMPSGQSHMPC